MKTWAAYILSFYILFCAVVPCTIMDDCTDSVRIEQTSNEGEADCNNCSPFSMCAANYAFNGSSIVTLVSPFTLQSSMAYADYHVSSEWDYSSGLFQPPRIGA